MFFFERYNAEMNIFKFKLGKKRSWGSKKVLGTVTITKVNKEKGIITTSIAKPLKRLKNKE